MAGTYSADIRQCLWFTTAINDDFTGFLAWMDYQLLQFWIRGNKYQLDIGIMFFKILMSNQEHGIRNHGVTNLIGRVDFRSRPFPNWDIRLIDGYKIYKYQSSLNSLTKQIRPRRAQFDRIMTATFTWHWAYESGREHRAGLDGAQRRAKSWTITTMAAS